MSIDLTFPGPYDQGELEALLYQEMCSRAKNDIQYAIDNPWGEFRVMMGNRIIGVQWRFVGLEPEDYEENEHGDWIPAGEYHWEYGGPDFEVSCSWVEQ